MNRPKTTNCKRTQELKIINSSQTECPLNNPELPIISELDHKTGHCFCHLCTCGKHSCSFHPKSNTPSLKSWKSQYKINFNAKKGTKTGPCLPQEYLSFLKTKSTSELVTTSKSDFKKQKNFKIENFKPENNQVFFKFSARSSYERDFANWNLGYINCKPGVLPYRGYMVKPTHNESLYKSNFKEYDCKSANEFLQTSRNFNSSNISRVKSLVGLSNNKLYETTSQSAFKSVSKEKNFGSDIAKIKNSSEIPSMVHAKNQYTTSYMSDFISKPLHLELRRHR